MHNFNEELQNLYAITDALKDQIAEATKATEVASTVNYVRYLKDGVMTVIRRNDKFPENIAFLVKHLFKIEDELKVTPLY